MNVKDFVILGVSLSAVAVADVLLKRAEMSGTFSNALTSKWLLWAALLYLLQIAGFLYLFTNGASLSEVGMLQTGIYAIIVLSFGYVFGERLSTAQWTGVVCIVIGVCLLKLPGKTG